MQARHKDEADAVVEAIDGALGPEQIETVIDAICTANWPDATRRYKEELEKLRERVRKGLPLPNVPSADAL